MENENLMTVTSEIKAELLCSAKWANFLAIVCTIGIVGLAVLGFVMMIFGATEMTSEVIPISLLDLLWVGILYLFMSILYIYPVIKAFSFCSNIKTACMTDSQENLFIGFKSMRQFLVYMGILTIVVIALYVLAAIILSIVGLAILQSW
ncbi:MAG: hypothetical protein Q3994_00020 [Prevotella sp.]|nr:hypothetical protein [Prevotella sp.]